MPTICSGFSTQSGAFSSEQSCSHLQEKSCTERKREPLCRSLPDNFSDAPSLSGRKKSRTRRKMISLHGSLPHGISVEQSRSSWLMKNPVYDRITLMLQKRKMMLLGLGHKSRERKHDKITRWLQGNEMDLGEVGEIPEGISTAEVKLTMSDNILEEIDLGEEIPEGISTSVGKLSISDLRPSPEVLEIFSNCLQDINLQVHELDLSHSAVLGEDMIKHIGVIVRRSTVSSLLLQGCELNLRTMLDLQKSMDNTMLTNLDVSKPDTGKKTPMDLGPDGVAVLGDIVSDCGIQKLALRNHNLRQKHMSKLRQSLACAKLFEVDVSGNDSLGPDGIAELARLVHEAEVKTLIMRNCGLDPENLLKLKDSIGDSKLTTLDVSENTRLGTDGMTCIGIIVNQCDITDLLLRDCSLTQGHMTALKQSLDGFMLMELDIGKRRGPAQALSSLDSDSTKSIDETGDTEQDDESEVISEQSEETFSESEEPEEQKLPDDTAAAVHSPLFQKNLSRFQPEQLVINLLPNVKKHLNMDNWEIEKRGEKILEDEMRKRKLPHLEISFGSGSQKKVISIHREHADKQTGTAKKVLWADAPSTLQITGQHAEETGTSLGPVKRWSMVILTAALSLVFLMLLMRTILHEDAIKNDAGPNVYIIGEEGGKLSHLGCSIIFPPKAVSKDTRLTLKVEHPTNIPVKLMPITPMISCEPDLKKFAKSVTIELQTWAVAKNDHVMAKILRRDPDGDWEIYKEISFSSGVITFEIEHFSFYTTVLETVSWIFNHPVWQSKFFLDHATDYLHQKGGVDFLIKNHVHHNENGRIRVTFSVKSELMDEDIKAMEKNNGYKDLLHLPIMMNLNVGDVIKYELSHFNPKGVSFMTESDTKDILKATIPVLSISKHQRYVKDLFLAVHDESFSGSVTIAYKITKGHDDNDNESRFIDLCWPSNGNQKNIARMSNALTGPAPANKIENEVNQIQFDEPARDEL